MRAIALFVSMLFCISLSAEVKINGAGASFPYPYYTKIMSIYSQKNPEIKINYQSIGSGGGVKQTIAETVDFGASDVPMKARELKKAKKKIYHIPTVLGAVVVIYNLKDVPTLRLDGEVLAQIFMGRIAKWNSPEIAKLNPGITLPGKKILVTRRSDRSGTTAIFTQYLSSASSRWQKSVGAGKAVKWKTGVGSKGNEGVAGTVKQVEGAVGYVEVAYALQNKIAMATLKNKAGDWLKPSVEAISLAAQTVAKSGNFTDSIVNSPVKGAYPISSFTYILLPEKKQKDKQYQALLNFLKWAVVDEGYKYASALHYAPLPKAVRSQVSNILQGL